MNWLTLLSDQLPLLLMLSPAIGCLVCSTAAWSKHAVVRRIAVANTICTLILLGGVAWRATLDRNEEFAARQFTPEPGATPRSVADDREILHRQADKLRAERFSKCFLAADGVNLWPTFLLVLVTSIILWHTEAAEIHLRWFAPAVLLFESASLGAMLAYDVRLYLVAFGTAVFIMSVIIGQWGGSGRRTLAERFLWTQLCGGAFVMLGFAMLVMAVPWMKIEDAPAPPKALWNIAAIAFDIQKWMSNNQLAFHYAGEVFPWMFCLTSCGFAIQFGLFPFHGPMTAILRSTPAPLAVLCLVGLSSVAGTGWLRFVFPIAPSLLVGLDWMIVTLALGSALWGALHAVAPVSPQARTAHLFLAMSGLSLLGCHAFSLTGLCSLWLIQQQLMTSLALSWLGLGALSIGASDNASPSQPRVSNRIQILMVAMFGIGLFASSVLLFSDLITRSLIILACTLTTGALAGLSVYRMLDESLTQSGSRREKPPAFSRRRWALVPLIVAAGIVNLAPNLMLSQCEPEFARHFPRFEPKSAADSAERHPGDQPESP